MGLFGGTQIETNKEEFSAECHSVDWSLPFGRGSRVEKFFTIIFERRQIKISCLLEFPVSVLFYIHT